MNALTDLLLIDLSGLSVFSTGWIGVLVDAAIKGSVVLAVAWGVGVLLRGVSAAWRHLLWCVTAASLIALPVGSAMLPAWRVPILPAVAPVGPEVPPTANAGRVDRARWLGLEKDVKPDADERASATPAEKPAVPSAAPAARPSHAPEKTEPMAAPAEGPRTPLHWSAWIVLVWISGAVLTAAWLLIGTIGVRWIARRARPIHDGPWPALLRRLAEQMAVGRKVNLLQSDRPIMPMTCGVFRPVVLLPTSADDWSADRRRMVLLHELAHVQRRDCLTQLVARIACALHWFNPLAWLAARQLRIERERACDDFVLRAGAKPSDYAGQLLEIARTFRSPRCPLVAAVAMARPSQMEGRMLAILDGGRRRGAVSRFGVVVTVAAALCVVLPLAVLRPAARAQDAPPAEPTPGRARVVQFPEDRSLGVLSVRDRQAVRDAEPDKYIPWKALGEAQGRVTIAADMELRLVLKPKTLADPAPLAELGPADIQWLDFPFARYFGDKPPQGDNVLAHLQGWTGLETLNVRGVEITNEGLAAVSALTSLKSLNLFSLKITDAGLAHLKPLASLKSLDLRVTKITDAGLAALAELASLERLHLPQQITDAGLAHLRKLPSLRSLYFTWGGRGEESGITDAGVAILAEIDSLETLSLGWTQVDDAGLTALARLGSLKRLYLHYTQITDAGMAALRETKSLEALHLQGTAVGDACLAELKELTSLQDLYLGGTKVTDAGLAHLAGLTALKNLSLPDGITDAGLAVLENFTELKSLHLSSAKISDAGLAHLAGLTKLEMLRVSGAGMTDEGVAALANLTALKQLWLISTSVSDAGLQHLSGLRSMERLYLYNTQIGDEGLAALAEMTALKSLHLSGTNVTDAGLVHLKGLTALEELNLGGTRITDAGLVHLAGLPSLKRLFLQGTQVTDKGVAVLADMNLDVLDVTATPAKPPKTELTAEDIPQSAYELIDATVQNEADRQCVRDALAVVMKREADFGGRVPVGQRLEDIFVVFVAHALADCGFLDEGYEIAMKMSRKKDGAVHASGPGYAGKFFARMRREHPNAGMRLIGAAQPLSSNQVEVYWCVCPPGLAVGLARDGLAYRMEAQPGVLAGYQAEIQVSADKETFRVVDTVDAATQRFVWKDAVSGKQLWFRVVAKDTDGAALAISEPFLGATGRDLLGGDGDFEAMSLGEVTWKTMGPWRGQNIFGLPLKGYSVVEGRRPLSAGSKCIASDTPREFQSALKQAWFARRPVEADPNKRYVLGFWASVQEGELGIGRAAIGEDGKPISMTGMGWVDPSEGWGLHVQPLRPGGEVPKKEREDEFPYQDLFGGGKMPPNQKFLRAGIYANGKARIDDVFLVACAPATDADLQGLETAAEPVVDPDKARAFLARIAERRGG